MNKWLYKFSQMLNYIVMLILIAAFSGAAQADIVQYTLVNVIQTNGSQMSGTFQWEYTVGDFENGTGTFSELSLPGHGSDISALNITFDIDKSIEFSLIENLHNTGVDVTLYILTPLTPTSTATVDTMRSKWQIGGGFNGSPTEGGFISGIITPDSDGDEVFDHIDNCTDAANSNQTDTDADGYGNACDADFNNDCIVNFSDISAFANEFLGSNALFDINSDGVVNFLDFVVVSQAFLQEPGPGQGGCQ